MKNNNNMKMKIIIVIIINKIIWCNEIIYEMIIWKIIIIKENNEIMKNKWNNEKWIIIMWNENNEK